MDSHTIPRQYVVTSISIARLPLQIAALMTKHVGDQSWPPVLAFDGFDANVRQIVGSLIGDEELAHQGRLSQTRVAELRDAQRLRIVAERTEAEAEETLDESRTNAERRRNESAARSEARRAGAARRERQAKADADAAADVRAARARQLEADRKKVAAKKRREARTREIAKERAAVSRAKAAAEAESAANRTDKKIQASKARRRSA